MADERARPLLAPGNDARWAEINREKAEHHRASARALSPAQRIEQGQTLSQQAMARVASLNSIIGFKRLAGRSRDRNDLEELEAFHGELPIEPIPGLDS